MRKRVREAEEAEGPPTTGKKQQRLEGRCMPDTFQVKLGPGFDEVPDEALMGPFCDMESLVKDMPTLEDLPPARREFLCGRVRLLVDAVNSKPNLSAQQLEGLYGKFSRAKGSTEVARKSQLTEAYRRLVRSGEIAPSQRVEEVLTRKKGKSHSGVLVISTFMGPSQFSCPKDCYYCPNQPGIARSYLLREPAVLRGFRNSWDPIRQFMDRASALECNGHVVDKIEIIILGGTFSFYPKEYAEEFVAATFYAANTYYDVLPLRAMKSLAEECTFNETARCRIIGLTIETRPDYISLLELRRFRALGVTRIQLGIQHLDDRVLEYVNRQCPTRKAVEAIRLCLDAGFKVDAHWMPDLPSSSYEKDLEMFQFLFSDKNSDFQVDQWKVYPTATVPFTRILEWYTAGDYKPYAEENNGQKMKDLLIYIMQNCPYRIRLNRIVRDIPSDYISGGERRCNLRQSVEAEMLERGIACRDIRARECKGTPIDISQTALFEDEFRSSHGTEIYFSVESKDRKALFGHLRLRLRDDSTNSLFPCLDGAALVRELHTYGKLLAVDAANTGKGEAQHTGVGKQLLLRAEMVAHERGFQKVAVISGIGVRKYYERRGYHLEQTYMVKDLAKNPVDTSSAVFGLLKRLRSLLPF